MISRKPSASATSRDQPEHELAGRGATNTTIRTTSSTPERRVQRVLVFERDRRALHQGLQLGERDQRAGEGDGADRQADRHLEQALAEDVARRADAERFRRVQCAAAATNTAARPTSEWNAATNCGSAVIWMRRDHGDADARRR